MTTGGASTERGTTRQSGPTPFRFAFGAVEFELRASSRELSFEPPPLGSAPAEPRAEGMAGQVQCEVRADPTTTTVPAGEPRPIDWARDSTGWEVATSGVRARVWKCDEAAREHPARYRARARVAPQPGAIGSLASALSSLIVSEAGGLCLHAASVELDGGVVAFIGPSGAGKSTACGLCAPAPQFSLDRLATTRTPGGRWIAHALPGGTPLGLSRSSARSLPLVAVLRVRHAETHPEVIAAASLSSRARWLLNVRQSCFVGSRDRKSELRLLDSLEVLCREILVGEIRTKLGRSALPALTDWLSTKGSNHGS